MFFYERTPGQIDRYAQQPARDPLPKVRELNEGASGLSALAAEARRQQGMFDELQRMEAVPRSHLTIEPPPAIKFMQGAEERRRRRAQRRVAYVIKDFVKPASVIELRKE